ncbi:MAG: hypothetical protein AB8F95_12435, partial [Bacteroidia bacterium]
GTSGILRLLGEANAHKLSHVVMPNRQADALGETIGDCQSQWLDTVHRGNTFTVIGFKDINKLMPVWIPVRRDSFEWHPPQDSCLELPWTSRVEGFLCEEISPQRKYGFNLDLSWQYFQKTERKLSISCLLKHSSPKPVSKFIAILKKQEGQDWIADYPLLDSAYFDWKRDTFNITIPAFDVSPPADTNQSIGCFIVNDNPTDTLWIRDAKMWLE